MAETIARVVLNRNHIHLFIKHLLCDAIIVWTKRTFEVKCLEPLHYNFFKWFDYTEIVMCILLRFHYINFTYSLHIVLFKLFCSAFNIPETCIILPKIVWIELKPD